jgi:hypothetical protein
MRPAWKELAKRGDQRTYGAEQVAEAASYALAVDFKNEVSAALLSALKDVFSGRNNSLRLPEIALQELNDAKTLAAGSVFGMNAIAWSIQLVREGRLDSAALYDAVGLAAKERGSATTRSMQEHFVRKSNQRRADSMSARVISAIAGLVETALGAALVDREPGAFRRPRKRTEISDGVPL